MYTDDTSITFAGSHVDEINSCINLDLERIRAWLAANQLTLNKTKTEFLLIGSKQRLLHFTSNPIGVHIEENLTWECHINKLLKRLLLV